MSSDICYLLQLGVPMEEIARRASRTVTSIENELRRSMKESNDRPRT